MRRFVPLLLPVLLSATFPDEQHRLADAKRLAAAATARADALTAAAARETDAASRARDEEQALGTRVEAARAGVAAAAVRLRLVGELQARQRARLAAAQAPLARLLAGLTELARRPAVATLAQPGSLDDLVHVQAVLGAAAPVVAARTAGVRAELAATRRLATGAALATRALADGRATLEAQQRQLAALVATHRRAALALTRRSVTQSDQALALGERARDLVDRLAEQGEAVTTTGELAGLAGPAPRPGALPEPSGPRAYRLPVAGMLVTGLGEVSTAGVRSRGLTFAVAAGSVVMAPAGGTVRYARPFRRFGTIVIIDHGGGWSTLLTGLGVASVRPGEAVAGGAAIGRAATGEEARVTVELRRRGRPVDVAALL